MAYMPASSLARSALYSLHQALPFPSGHGWRGGNRFVLARSLFRLQLGGAVCERQLARPGTTLIGVLGIGLFWLRERPKPVFLGMDKSNRCNESYRL